MTIGKVLRGKKVKGLFWYLYGPGKANEHVNPHLVAGFEPPALLEPPVCADGRRNFRHLSGLLNDPLAALGADGYDRPVWHCIVRNAPEDRVLSDAEWDTVAREIMHRTGLAPRDDQDGVRWVAIRHAEDHIHIVATLARQDGGKPDIWNDFYRVREACREIEGQFGLRTTAAGDRTAARRPTRAETEQARRRRWSEVPRVALRRHVTTAAAGAASEEEFFTALEAAGVRVKKRLSEVNPGEVTGFAVALNGLEYATVGGGPVWYGGGKLAADLTLPKLRRRWSGDAPTAGEEVRPGRNRQPLPAGHTKRAVLRVAARKAAVSAANEWEFFEGLEAVGVLVRPRLSEQNPGVVTGYSVSLPGHVDSEGDQFWYGGGSLAAELSLPRLRRAWAGDGGAGRPIRLTAQERRAIWDHAAMAASSAAGHIRDWADIDPAAADDAAWAALDALNVTAKALNSRALRGAAEAYDRAARQPYGRIPRPSPAGNRLRAAARLLALTGRAERRALMPIRLVSSLGILAYRVSDLRKAERRAAQAAGARVAAERLLHALPAAAATAGRPDSVRAPGSASQLARRDSPVGVRRPVRTARPVVPESRPQPGRRRNEPPTPRRPGR